MISIIIPVFNAEKYIERCILSVCKLKNAQIIIVDDCSTDNTLEILSKFKNITLLKNEKNMGTGISRNKGLLAANSEYIGFLDNDDWVDEFYFEDMVEKIQKENADVCAALKITNHKENKEKMHLAFLDDLREILFVERTAPWAKIYRRDFLLENRIFFDNTRGEDIFPAFLQAFCAKKITYTKNFSYHCRIHDESISHKNIEEADILELRIYEKIFNHLEKNNSKNKYWINLVKKRGEISFDFLYRFSDENLKKAVIKEYETVFNLKITPFFLNRLKFSKNMHNFLTFLNASIDNIKNSK